MSTDKNFAFGFGVATQNSSGQVLDCFFYSLGLGELTNSHLNSDLAAQIGIDEIRKVKKISVELKIDLSDKPKDAIDVYLRLHLLSHRLIKPNELNLDGIFGLLSNVVWTSAGPCDVDSFSEVRIKLQNKYGNLTVYSIDKFPRMIDYVIPDGVRIADGDRVRLGAYLSPGTTIMHEGFVNFNAGTLGKSMVEGRISAGVTVDDGSDIGGGASIMGTLSGGGKEVISIGKRTLLGANSGIGISLGDDCIVEAGVYITAGSKITLPDGTIVKAKELNKASNLLFRRNSQTGSLEALPKTGTWAGLNSVLHSN
ncbi:MAG: 2,3,4,5-tetrahydropyridine-2,6-dicarboxylate N-succinyltransferase [Actinobacteria bacterium]|jgi:2,3,4,5-tetrahydropyridine-2-carboxylate N-succinyltransferase|nr:2,3,4,5-tetrahydropyridine-2,6-dicarboxylate N-succinyltransferase [Actinomycetota bacterium]